MIDKVEIRKDVIKMIATSAVQRGVTILGGVAGVGKTETAHTVIQYIKENNLMPDSHVLYINTLAEHEKDDGIYGVATDFLASLPDDSHALIVLDELYYEDSVDLALMLAQYNQSVLGITQAYPHPSSPTGTEAAMSSILAHATLRGQDNLKPVRIHALVNVLNDLVMQDSLSPNHHRFLRINDSVKTQVYDDMMEKSQGFNHLITPVTEESVHDIYSKIDALPVVRK